jgi:hypothetical protein
VDLLGLELACLAGGKMHGFTDQHVGRCMVLALTFMDLCE